MGDNESGLSAKIIKLSDASKKADAREILNLASKRMRDNAPRNRSEFVEALRKVRKEMGRGE